MLLSPYPLKYGIFFGLNRLSLNLIALIAARPPDAHPEKMIIRGIFIAIHTFGRDLSRAGLEDRGKR